MALTQVTGPYPIFTDLDGTPLDDGYLYIGEINEDPETNPIQVYWDSALTIVATQPIRTSNGYAYRNGSPALLYTAGEFSITIRNKRQEFVLYSPVGYGFDPAAVSASVVKNDFTGDGVEVDFTLSASPSTKLATSVFINGVYQEKDSYSILGNVLTFTIAPPLNSSIEVMTNETGVIGSTNASLVSYTAGFTGAVAQTVQTKLEQYVSVKDFGAVGDGVTDDTAAIQAALDYCETSGAQIYGNQGTYLITSTLVIKCSGDMSSMFIEADATLFSPAIRVGPNTAAQYLFDADIKLPKITNTAKAGPGWVGFDTAIGVLCANVYQSRITVPYTYNFGVGLKVGGFSVGNVYNTYIIGVLFNNKVNLLCQPGDGSGWSNQNTFIGGRYGYSSAEGVAVSGVAQIKLRDFTPGGVQAPNTNVWINPSIEGDEPEFHLDIQGSFNTFISPRLEVTNPLTANINFYAATVGETSGNYLYGGYAFGVAYTYAGAGTSVNNGWIGARANSALDFSGNGYNVRNTNGNSIASPHFQGFPSSVQPLPGTASSTNWTYRIFGEGFATKSTGDTQPRVQMDASGYVFFGSGAAAVAGGIRYNSSALAITSNINFAPDANASLTLGTSNRQWSTIWATLATYANNAAALAGGLTAGAFYKTVTGEVRVVV